MRTLRETCATAGFFVVRAPAFPFDVLTDWSRASRGATSPAGLRERLKCQVARPEVREAIAVAAPSVDERIDGWLAGQSVGPETRRLERTLVRYLQRMCWRATPFGLFAGVAAGTVADSTCVRLGPREDRRRTSSVDAELLGRITTTLARDASVQAQLRYRRPACAHWTADEIVLMVRRPDGGSGACALRLPRGPALEQVLRSADGATVEGLVEDLCASQSGLARDDAERLVMTLIRSNILGHDLEPPIIGADPVVHVIERMASLEGAEETHGVLSDVARELSSIDAGARSGAFSHLSYRTAAKRLARLPSVQTTARPFHVVMTHATASAELDHGVVDEALRGACALSRLAQPSDDPLEEFRLAFSTRYGEREVPLVEALDETIGIGFDLGGSTLEPAPPLLRDLELADLKPRGSRRSWTERDRWLSRAVVEASRNGSDEITVSDSILEVVGRDPRGNSDSLAVCGTLHLEGQTNAAAADYRFHVRRVVGPTGGALLGRFCATDPTIAAHTRALAEREAALVPDAIVAEVVHAPHPRTGNVAARPTLRAYEIPLLGRSASTGVIHLPLDDLVVSVRAGRVCLHSRGQGKPVLPRLTYGDNTRLPGLPAYRFLASLARSQGVVAEWDWGGLEYVEALPRVGYGRCILALARWRVAAVELEELAAVYPGQRRDRIQDLRARRRLPRWVAWVERDRTMPVDLDNPLSVDAFVHAARGADAVVEEMFPGTGAPLVHGPDGRYAHELILPYLRKRPRAAAPSRTGAVGEGLTRAHVPGGQWLYAKLYCTGGAAERVLREFVLPLVQGLGELISHWFFIRHGDPDWHVRLRLRGHPEALWGKVLPRLNEVMAPALESGLVHRVALDTYQPEWERYGGAAALPALEHVFHHDSEAALALVARYAADDVARWQLALLGMYRLVGLWPASEDERVEIVRTAREHFVREFGLVGRSGRVLGRRFRDTRAELTELFAGQLPRSHRLRPALEVLDERDAHIASILGEQGGRGEAGHRIVRSLLHMHANRMLCSSHRLQEAFLYDFLMRQLRAERARNRHQ